MPKLELAREDIRWHCSTMAMYRREHGWLSLKLKRAFCHYCHCETRLETRSSYRGYAHFRKDLLSIWNIYPVDRVTKNDIPKFTERIKAHLKQLGYPDSKVENSNQTGHNRRICCRSKRQKRTMVFKRGLSHQNPHVDSMALKRLMGPKRTISAASL